MKIQVDYRPAIAGILGGKNSAINAESISPMLRALKYGGRKVLGAYGNAQSGIWIGWMGLQDSGMANFPVWDKSRTIGLVLLGELYSNGPDHLDSLHSVLNDYEKEGIRCLEQLNGWFGGVLIDIRNQRAVLFNDRYGLFKINYHNGPNGFFFSSEAKAILAVIPESRQLDMKSVAEFMSCNCTLQNRSMFSGISLLPGGSAWTFSQNQGVKRAFYFDKSVWEGQETLGIVEYHDKIRETWTRILPRYFSGDRIGLSLTGGVDSRMILAWAPRSEGELPCYTFAGRYRDSMDIQVARHVAQICGQPHETIYVDSDFLKSFPELAENCVFISDGTMDVTGSIDLYVQMIARNIAPIRITGTNGGEIMRSLVAFKPGNMSADGLSAEFKSLFQAVPAIYLSELNENRLSFTAFKQVPWYMNTKFSIERSQIRIRMPYFDNDLVSLVYRAPKELSTDNRVALRLIAEGNQALASVVTDRGLAFRSVPFFMQARHALHQFTFKLEYAYDYGMPHWLARLDRVLSPLHLEKYILGRHKFHHFRVWYRDELSNYLKSVLLDGRTLKRPYLDGNVLQRMVGDHMGGTRNYTREFHKILTIELIQRRFLNS